MKTRTVFIYIGILLLVGGYFAYFEVFQEQQKIAREKAASHLFHLSSSEVTGLSLASKENGTIVLHKENDWLIVEPVRTRADNFVVTGILATLQNMKAERRLELAKSSTADYGLDAPLLQVAFETADSQHRLKIGAKTPVGNQFYALADDPTSVVLISAAAERVLNRTLFDLRQKEMFTFKAEQIDRLEVEQSGKKIAIGRRDKDNWTALLPAAAKIRLKSTKVEELLHALLGTRASGFLDQGAVDLVGLGLQPPRARVRLFSKKKGQTLLLGNIAREQGVYAKSDQIASVAIVNKDVLAKLPSSLADLQDRTLLSFATEQVRAISLQVGAKSGTLERRKQEWSWQ
ncbi:MAG: DUF4340 domain-containing protein, partial [Deltaproteobacteria bacterium]|nr:DUF4340 domain-containing protein [Deltaproteobacteria bacterium]